MRRSAPEAPLLGRSSLQQGAVTAPAHCTCTAACDCGQYVTGLASAVRLYTTSDTRSQATGLHSRRRRYLGRSHKRHVGVDNGHTGCRPLGQWTGASVLRRGRRRAGAGKTTLLKVLGGKHMVGEGAVRVLGASPFHDTSLTASGRLSYLGGNWERDIAFAGYSIPLQARRRIGCMPACLARIPEGSGKGGAPFPCHAIGRESERDLHSMYVCSETR